MKEHSPESTRSAPSFLWKRIRFSDGSWWLQDPERQVVVCLDPMFEECEWNVGVLCKSLGIGKRTFARLVEDSLGLTPKAWLRKIRVVRACHMIREGGKIAPIAHKLGFLDYSDFTRDFKKLLGVSPSYVMRSEFSFSDGNRTCGPD